MDRGSLDAALALGFPCGGWCPQGRRAEDGQIGSAYPLEETESGDYRQRTEWNVRDSDATLILHEGELEGGTALTRNLAERYGKPCLVVDLAAAADPTAVIGWLERNRVRKLNLAGPRESKCPGIALRAERFLTRLLTGSEST